MKIRPASPGIDRRLKQRLTQYLSSNRCGGFVDLAAVAADLQRTYSAEYGRRKRNAFRIQVEKVFKVLCSENEDVAALEEAHLAKRARRGADGDLDSPSDDSTDSDDLTDEPSSNHMNTSLLSLYRKENPESTTETPSKNEIPQTSTPTPHNATPAPHNATPAPHNATPAPHNATPAPHNATPAPHNATPAPHNATPAPHNATPAPHNATPATPAPRKATPAPHKATPAPHKATPAEATGKTSERKTSHRKPSGPGWFIDKTPSKAIEKNIFIDLCDDGEEGPKTEDREKSMDTSLLEPEKKRVKVRKSRREKVDSQDVDEEIKSLLIKRAETIELQKSSVRFEHVGGNDDTLTEVCKLLIHMRHPEVYQHLGVVPPRGFLLHGPPGCGKTLLAQAIAGELDLPMLKVAATEMVSGVSGESEQKLRTLFEQAVNNAPCILFIDEIDAITPKREVASKDMERRIVAQLLTCMDDLNNPSVAAQVLVIGATNRPDSLDPALRRAGRFDREICLGIPDEGARLKILKTLCRKLRLPESFDFPRLAHLTPGYVGADLMALCREAAMCAVNRALIQLRCHPAMALEEDDPTTALPEVKPAQKELQRLLEVLMELSPFPEQQLQGLCIEMNDFLTALPSVQPSAKREGFATVPDVTWADIGALDEIREELTMAILAPVRNPEQFKALGLMAPAGVLLAGPPGCGKTLLAKAVANESGLNFISVKGPELLNMYVGESERAVRQVFQRASNSSPCVIFFDEIDALCPRRSSHESGAGIRVVNQLLTEMDGLESRRQVFIMAATNRPDIIDPAILRPGRLDKTLYVGLPPPSDRLAILRTLTKNGSRPPLGPDVDLEAIASDDKCDCFTGADLSALVREASISALRSEVLQSHPAVTRGDLLVYKKHFDEAFKKVKPSVSKTDQKMYERLRQSLGGE